MTCPTAWATATPWVEIIADLHLRYSHSFQWYRYWKIANISPLIKQLGSTVRATTGFTNWCKLVLLLPSLITVSLHLLLSFATSFSWIQRCLFWLLDIQYWNLKFSKLPSQHEKCSPPPKKKRTDLSSTNVINISKIKHKMNSIIVYCA